MRAPMVVKWNPKNHIEDPQFPFRHFILYVLFENSFLQTLQLFYSTNDGMSHKTNRFFGVS